MHLDRRQQMATGLAVLPVVLIWQVNGIYLAALARIDALLFWAADVVQWIALPTILLIFLAKKASVFPKHYGLDTSDLRWQTLTLGTVGVSITAGLAFYLARNWAWQLFGQPTGFFTFPGVFPTGSLGTVIWFYSAITAGIVESIFYIGLPWLLYRNLKIKPSRISFALVASTVFAMAHWEQGPHIVTAALFFNLVACAWYFKLGSLWPIVAGHTLIDLLAFS